MKYYQYRSAIISPQCCIRACGSWPDGAPETGIIEFPDSPSPEIFSFRVSSEWRQNGRHFGTSRTEYIRGRLLF